MSWKFIEQPFRDASKVSRKAIFVSALICELTFLIAGLFYHFYGYEIALQKEKLGVLFDFSSLERPSKFYCDSYHQKNMHLPSTKDWFCKIGTDNVRPTFIFLGDSHLNALLPAIDRILTEKKLSGIVVGAGAFKPLLGAYAIRSDQHVINHNQLIKRSIKKAVSDDIKNIVLIAAWNNSLNGLEEGNWDYLGRTPEAEKSANESIETFKFALNTTLEELTKLGKVVYLVGQAPYLTQGGFLDVAATQGAYGEGFYWMRKPQALDVEIFKAANAKFRQNLKIIDLADFFCINDKCKIGTKKYSFYWDTNHINSFGAMETLDFLGSELEGI